MTTIELNLEATDHTEIKILDGFSEAKIHVVEANVTKIHIKVNITVMTTKLIVDNIGRSNYHGLSHGRSNY